MQIEAIIHAKRLGRDKFNFPGELEPIDHLKTWAFCVTMNPGYAGRQ